jgi:hypothetical protein
MLQFIVSSSIVLTLIALIVFLSLFSGEILRRALFNANRRVNSSHGTGRLATALGHSVASFQSKK